jgi:hypothetical protein
MGTYLPYRFDRYERPKWHLTKHEVVLLDGHSQEAIQRDLLFGEQSSWTDGDAGRNDKR